MNGLHQANDLQKLLNVFIDKFVLCPKCHLPETALAVRKGLIKHKCSACGAKETVDMSHKLCTFILKEATAAAAMAAGADDSAADKKARKAAKKAAAETEDAGDDAAAAAEKKARKAAKKAAAAAAEAEDAADEPKKESKKEKKGARDGGPLGGGVGRVPRSPHATTTAADPTPAPCRQEGRACLVCPRQRRR